MQLIIFNPVYITVCRITKRNKNVLSFPLFSSADVI